jgi:exopolyphosphatase/guanosine-5'-triphosphate,3'-diphosphate pyrophosphatase
MSITRRAVIDVGTNSIKLLVADVAGKAVHPVLEDSKQTRLGEGFYQSHVLQPEAIRRTAEAVARFAVKARDLHAAEPRVIATSATREAVNAAELQEAIRAASGLEAVVISGEQEAELAFRGATSDPALRQCPILLMDLGGGSTEFILGEGETIHFRNSFRLGTVRMLEQLPHSDPPTAGELSACRKWLKDFMEQQVRPELETELRWEQRIHADPTIQLVGTGGTASILARMERQIHSYDRNLIESTRLPLDRVRWHLAHLYSLPLAQRRQTVGLPANRADVILTGVAIYEAVMAEFQFTELRISTRGLRFAAVMDGEIPEQP